MKMKDKIALLETQLQEARADERARVDTICDLDVQIDELKKIIMVKENIITALDKRITTERIDCYVHVIEILADKLKGETND